MLEAQPRAAHAICLRAIETPLRQTSLAPTQLKIFHPPDAVSALAQFTEPHRTESK